MKLILIALLVALPLSAIATSNPDLEARAMKSITDSNALLGKAGEYNLAARYKEAAALTKHCMDMLSHTYAVKTFSSANAVYKEKVREIFTYCSVMNSVTQYKGQLIGDEEYKAQLLEQTNHLRSKPAAEQLGAYYAGKKQFKDSLRYLIKGYSDYSDENMQYLGNALHLSNPDSRQTYLAALMLHMVASEHRQKDKAYLLAPQDIDTERLFNELDASSKAKVLRLKKDYAAAKKADKPFDEFMAEITKG